MPRESLQIITATTEKSQLLLDLRHVQPTRETSLFRTRRLRISPHVFLYFYKFFSSTVGNKLLLITPPPLSRPRFDWLFNFFRESLFHQTFIKSPQLIFYAGIVAVFCLNSFTPFGDKCAGLRLIFECVTPFWFSSLLMYHRTSSVHGNETLNGVSNLQTI